ncbi:MAG: M20/M25/M40 family metallo-hydrolase [Myxococcota bacterium]
MRDVVDLTRTLVRIPSLSNQEAEVCDFVEDALRSDGWTVRTQPVPVDPGASPCPGRRNILALQSEEAPQVVLTTHLDTVPPFIDLTEDESCLWGRGTCDAKGIFAAQWVAAERLRAGGARGVALLAVVGEETDSRGAKMVSELLPRADWIIDGEPTGLHMANGAKGILSFELESPGIPAHSAFPERGDSAVHRLVQSLVRLLEAELPSDPFFGQTTLNVGRIEGGVAPNVVAPHARAQVMVRLAAPAEAVLDHVRPLLDETLALTIKSRSEPHRIHALSGHPTEVVRFGSDVPYLSSIGTPLLVGPGSIHDAHTNHEHVGKSELKSAVDLYVEAAQALLAMPSKG